MVRQISRIAQLDYFTCLLLLRRRSQFGDLDPSLLLSIDSFCAIKVIRFLDGAAGQRSQSLFSLALEFRCFMMRATSRFC